MEAALVLFGIAGIIALAVVGSILKGWVLSILWGWFMVPLGAPTLSIPVAIGMSLVIAMLTHQSTAAKDEREWGEKMGAFAVAILSPLLILGVGWIVKQFV